jgi:hypothetical protein
MHPSFLPHLADPVTRSPLTLARIVRRALPVVGLPDGEWSVLDTFDSLAPAYQSTHDAAEVRGWLEGSGLVAVRQTSWGATAYRGLRAAAEATVTR